MKHILHYVNRLHAFSGKILYFNLLAMIMISLIEGIGILFLIPFINLTSISHVNLGDSSPLTWISGLLNKLPETFSLSLVLMIYVFLDDWSKLF